MKKFLALSIALCFGALLFPQKSLAGHDPIIQFIKGNISDKTAAVKRSPEDSSLAKRALDFVVQNSELLKGDRDLAALAVAGILSYPVSEYKAHPQEVTETFKSVFYTIDDATVKISIFDKVAAFYGELPFDALVFFVNDYLLRKTAANAPLDDTIKKSVEVLGKIGNGSSFNALYSILRSRLWQEIHSVVNASLVATADKSLNEIIDVVNQAELVELKLLFQIYEKNERISASLRSEIADKMLNRSMIIAGNSSLSRDLAEFQLESAQILSENQWTRSAELGKNYFSVAKSAYEVKFISDVQFANAIACVEKLSSRSAVRPFSDYMDQMNKAQESGNVPSKAVVLAIIDALGSLGDKSAFDCLLYVTYLNYPEDITSAARNALTRLKW